MSKTRSRPPVLADLSRPFWILFAVSFVGFLLLAGLLTVTQNRNAITSSQVVFGAILEDRLERLSALVLEYGYWDQAVERLVHTYSADWVDENFSGDLTVLGVNAAFVVNRRNATVVSSVEGEIVDQDYPAVLGDGIEALIEDARATKDNSAPTAVSGLIFGAGSYYFASAVRMTTYTSARDVSTDHVMIFAERIDQEYLSRKSVRYLFPKLRVSTSGPGSRQAGAPIVLRDGAMRDYFVWEPELPGFKMLPYLVAGVVAAFLAMFLSASLFARRSATFAAALEDARSAAVHANEAKSEFLRYVSHEVRSPVGAIVGFANLMRNRKHGPIGNERYEGYVDDIAKAGDHVLMLVNDLLDLERIEAGEMVFNISHFKVAEPLAESVDLVKASALDKSLRVELLVDDTLPRIHADKRMLRQMALNLLGNAVKFTPAGGSITCRAYKAGDSAVAIEVRDTGIGLEAASIPRILEPFGQLHVAGGDSLSGTGLGLPITKRLAESLDGSLTIESVVGEGTTATITLPIDARERPAL